MSVLWSIGCTPVLFLSRNSANTRKYRLDLDEIVGSNLEIRTVSYQIFILFLSFYLNESKIFLKEVILSLHKEN